MPWASQVMAIFICWLGEVISHCWAWAVGVNPNNNPTKTNNKKGEEELFAPSCCRIKNPVTGSHIVQDLEEFKTIVKGYQDLVNNYKTTARNLLLEATKLEVKAREEKLKNETLDTLIKITTNLVIEEYDHQPGQWTAAQEISRG